MATEHPQMQAQELTHAAEVKEVHEVFEKMRAQSDQPRLRGVTGVCLFDIEGAGSWRVSINDGKLTVAEGHEAALPPTSVIKVSAHDFLRIFHREHHLNLYSALMQGLFTVSGDSAFASALLTTAIWPTQALHR